MHCFLSAQFATFEYLTKAVHLNVTDQYKPAVYFICGSLSGAVGTTASLPFDTIRTRLVGQGEPKVIVAFVIIFLSWIANVLHVHACGFGFQIYRGVLHAFYTMVTVEGVTSLYKGLAPALLQIMPYAGVQFSAFHFFSKLLARDSLANNGMHYLRLFLNMRQICGECIHYATIFVWQKTQKSITSGKIC